MDIYSAQSHMKRLLAYIQEVHSSERRMYSKSKEKLKDLSDSCISIVNMISDILQDEMFTEKDDEFSGLDTSNILTIANKLGNQFNSIPGSNNISSQINSDDKRNAFSKYVSILDEVAHKDIPCNYVDNCAKIIWYWFERRFILTHDFRYSMKQLPIWIQFIVINYGYSINTNTDVMFIEDMRTWSDQLLISSVPYPFPYEIGRHYKHPFKSFANLTSVVMWDMLMSAGYDKLCKGYPKDLYFSEDGVYDYCGKLNPSELDNYVHYTTDSSILKTCKLMEVDV